MGKPYYLVNKEDKLIEISKKLGQLSNIDFSKQSLSEINDDVIENIFSSLTAFSEEVENLNVSKQDPNIFYPEQSKPADVTSNSIEETSMLAEIAKNSPFPFLRVDSDFNVIFVNEKGKTLKSNFFNENGDLKVELKTLLKAYLDEEIDQDELEYEINDKVYLLDVALIEKDRCFDIYARDIFELKRIQLDFLELSQELEELIQTRTDELDDALKHLSTVINNSNMILFATDPEGIFLLCEGNGLKVLGLKENQIVGTSIYDFYKEHPVIIQKISQALEGESGTERYSVSNYHFELSFLPNIEEGKVVGMIGLAFDITQLVDGEKKISSPC